MNAHRKALEAIEAELRYWNQEPFAREWPNDVEMIERIRALLPAPPKPVKCTG